jgi:solute carrier family 25 (adenine nucleotide translocator) protein 4/5/6/31
MKNWGNPLSFKENVMLSSLAAVGSKTLTAPIERVKLVLQCQDEMLKSGSLTRPFVGITDCVWWITKNEGVLAFWRSNMANCIRYVPTQAIMLSSKDKGTFGNMFLGKKTEGESAWKKYLRTVISGGFSGGTTLACVYSLDYARTKLANDLKSVRDGTAERQYTGLIDVYRQTLKTDGIVGLYRGFTISFIGIFVYRGIYFGLPRNVVVNRDSSTFVKFSASYAVTVAAGVMSYPIDTIRHRMMMTSGGDKSLMYNGSIDCAVQILKKEGFMSFMKGAGTNVLRGVAGACVLTGFDELQECYIKIVYPEYG